MSGDHRTGTDVDEDTTAEENPHHATGPTEVLTVDSAADLAATTGEWDLALVEFFAEWCGPCIAMEDDLDELAAETRAAVAKVDIDENQALASEHDVKSVPTMVLFVDGTPVDRIMGMPTKEELFEFVESRR
jgi:thioredoxin 1